MVALGVAGEVGGADKKAEVPAPLQGSTKDRSLHTSALWSPDIPQSDWHLNEDCFTGKDTPASEFRPLCYKLFGGPGGSSLQRLRQISVFYLDTCIKAIDFHYSTGEIQKLGYLLGNEEMFNFNIHGSQGETTETVDFDLDIQLANHEGAASFWRHGRLRSFRVSRHYLRINATV